MKQVLQNLSTGKTELVEIPALPSSDDKLLIRTRLSLISPGTERMLVEFSRAGLLDKARQQPDKVKQVLDKARTDGVAVTLEAVRSKLDEPLPLGYCNVGIVERAGRRTAGFAVEDRVVSNGPHAEVVSVAPRLAARIPDAVPDEEAVFAVVGAIALQGIRLARPTLGECFVVTGLGLIGLIATQLLRAHGCRVLGIDPDPKRAALAREFGAETVELHDGEDPIVAADVFSRGRGVDGVLLTLAADGSEPVSQAARMCRKRGRIVLVGVTGLELNRAEFYAKELSFQVSCSYGPGRYDPAYEEKGHDYPVAYVRWTEQRNFEAVLDMMASGALNVRPLITHRFAFDEAPKAYDLLAEGREPSLGIVLSYPQERRASAPAIRLQKAVRRVEGEPSFGFIGAGNYAGRVLIPAFRRAGAHLHSLANAGGIGGAHYARKYGFAEVTSDASGVLHAQDVDAVVVATRHDTHAEYVCRALQAGKHVYVEKPLALNEAELDRIADAYRAGGKESERPLVLVGFNRRFAPLVVKAKQLLRPLHEPKVIVITVNAGEIPAEHWTQDADEGGGRIIGEACHFVDLARHLAGSQIADCSVRTIRSPAPGPTDDKATINLSFDDGSMAAVHYLANGHRAFPKERVEIFCGGRILQLDNFRRLKGYGWPGFRQMSGWKQDKGHGACVRAFMDSLREGGPAPIAFDELLEVGRAVVRLGDEARRVGRAASTADRPDQAD